MTTNTPDLSPEELLEKQVSDAYREQDYAQVKDMLRAKDFPNAVKDSVLVTALRDGKTDIVRFVLEETGVEMTAERCMMLLFLASKQKQLDTVLYLSEKTAELGLMRSDAYEIVFSKFPADQHVPAADELLKRAADRQDALDKMLYAAASAKAFGVIPHLLDLGADPNPSGGTAIYMMTTDYDRNYFADRPKYLSLLEKYLSKFDDLGALDTALIVNAMKVPDGSQYPDTIHMLLQKGADPWGQRCEAQRVLEGAFAQLGQQHVSGMWHDTFTAAQQHDVQRHRHEFETLFGANFRTADLKQKINDDGDNGLTLAAKAKMLDRVMDQAAREDRPLITAGDIFETNARNQSVLSLAIDRGDAESLLAPAYWAKADPAIISEVNARLTEAQRPGIDLARIASSFDHFRLRQQAQRFKLKPT